MTTYLRNTASINDSNFKLVRRKLCKAGASESYGIYQGSDGKMRKST